MDTATDAKVLFSVEAKQTITSFFSAAAGGGKKSEPGISTC